MAQGKTEEQGRPAWRWRDRDALTSGFVVLAVFVAMFWPATLRGRFLILHDSWCWSYPLRSAAWQSLRRGELPLWSSGIFSGYPLFSMSQLGLAYPLTWAYAIDDAWGEQVYVLAPFLLSPLFVYAYLRELGRSNSAALLAGFAFTYGGFMASPITHNGLLSNGFMWLPLVLLAIERARHTAVASCLPVGVLSYGLAVLSGVGQAFLSVGMVALAYGAFVGIRPAAPRPWRSFARWRPTAVAFGSVAWGAALGAFQIIETWRANRLSLRKELNYASFIEGTAPISDVLVSALDPLHRQIGDVTSFIAPLVSLLAAIAIGRAFRRRATHEPLVLFWLGMALVAFLLMCGGSTPLYALVHHVPLLNLFRIPPRHAAEWTFAAAVLAAYGWDHLTERLTPRMESAERSFAGRAAVGLALIAALVTFRWMAVSETSGHAEYLVLKTLAALVLFGAAVVVLGLGRERLRTALSAGLIALGTVSESYICLSHWWFPAQKPREFLAQAAPVTEYLRRLPAATERVYSHINGFGEEDVSHHPVDAPNTTARWGIAEVGGYDPMILRRYSEALGDAGMFALPRTATQSPDAGYGGPFSFHSHVLDLLNVTHVVRRLQAGEHALPTSWEMRPAPDRLILDVGLPEARPFIDSGFSSDEAISGRSGAWSDAAHSVIRAYLLPGDAPYELRVTAIAFRPVSPLNVVVRVNGERLGTLRVRLDWRELSLEVSRDLLVEGWNEIELSYSKGVTPARVDDGSTDMRRLALFLDFLSLTPAE